jgi:hypothetical protein
LRKTIDLAMIVSLLLEGCMSRLGGWQRVGVVISALWLVAFPIYLMVDQNSRASEMHRLCFSSAYSRLGPSGWAGNKPAELKTAEDQCMASFVRMHAPPAKMLRLMAGLEGTDSLVFWAIIGVPLLLFWLVAGGVIVTVRWVRGGFARG